MDEKSILIAVALLTIIVSIGAVTIAQFQTMTEVETTGVTASLGLELTHLDGSPQATLDWGKVSNATPSILESILNNTSDIPLTVAMTTNNTIPVYLTQTWNITDNTLLAPNETIPIKWTLTVAVDAPQGEQFSYTTTIIGTEV